MSWQWTTFLPLSDAHPSPDVAHLCGERVIVEAAPGIAGVGQDARKFDILDPARPFMVADKKSELLDALVELAHQAAATSWLVMRPSISASTARISSAAALAPLPVSCHTGR